jgi:BirA family biotin operon repressor/biotin-[acetyl-CoA-carboxylase] ligase
VDPGVSVPPPYRLDLHETLGSTNDEALARARAGDPGGLWIVAREQTAGRGRQGRIWTSPRGNLHASLLLMDPSSQADAPQLSMVAGVALAGGVSQILRDDRRLGLKWPNDLLFARAKLAGILLEATRLDDGRLACVLGFGVNCCAHPADLPYPATDLSAIGRRVDPLDLLERLAKKMVEELEIWDQGRGLARIRERWMSFAVGLGEAIRVRTGQGVIEGRFQGLDERGRLALAIGEGVVTVDSGDVILPLGVDAQTFGLAAS